MSLSLQYALSSRSVVVEAAAMERAVSSSCHSLSGRRAIRAFTCGSSARLSPRIPASDAAAPAAAAAGTNAATAPAAARTAVSATHHNASRPFSTAAPREMKPAAAKTPPPTAPSAPATPATAPSAAAAAAPAAAAAAAAVSPGSLRTIHSKIQIHIKTGAVAKAESVWSRMLAAGQKPEAETYRHLMCVYLAASHVNHTRPKALWEQMDAAGLSFSAADYDALISEAHKHNRAKQVGTLSLKAKAAGMLPHLRRDVQTIVAALQLHEGPGKQKNKNAAGAAGPAAQSKHLKRAGGQAEAAAAASSSSFAGIPSASEIEDAVASAATTPATVSAKLAELLARATKMHAALGAATGGSAESSGLSKLVAEERALVAEAEQYWSMGLRMSCIFPRDTLSMMSIMAAAGRHQRMCDVMLDAARLERGAAAPQGQIQERMDAGCIKALFDALYVARERPGIGSVIDRAYQFFLLRYGSQQPESALAAYKPIINSYLKCLSRVRDVQLIREFIDLPAVYKLDHPALFALVWRAIESAGATDFAAEAQQIVAQMTEARCPLTANQAGVWLSAQSAEGAETVWRLMGEQGLAKNAMHYAQLMQSYLESEDPARVAKVEDIYAEMLEAGLELTAPLFEALVGSARDLDLDPIAERWISRARDKGCQIPRALVSPRPKLTPQQQEQPRQQERTEEQEADEQADKDDSDAAAAQVASAPASSTRPSSLLSMHRASRAPADLAARDARKGLVPDELPSGRRMLSEANVQKRRLRDDNRIDAQRAMLRDALKKHTVFNLFPAAAAAEAEVPTTTLADADAAAAAVATDKPADSPAAAGSVASDDLASSSALSRAVDDMLDVQNEALLQFPTGATAAVKKELVNKTDFKKLQAKGAKAVDRALDLLRSADAAGAAIPCDSERWLSILHCCEVLNLWDKALPAYQLMIQLHVSATARAALSQPPVSSDPAPVAPSQAESARAAREAELDARDPNPFPKLSPPTFPDSRLSQSLMTSLLLMAQHTDPLRMGDHVQRYFNYMRRARYPLNGEMAGLVLRAYANSLPRRFIGEEPPSDASLQQVRARYDALVKLPFVAADQQRAPSKTLLAVGMLGIYVRQRDHAAFEDLWAAVTKHGAHLSPPIISKRLDQIAARIEELMLEEYQLRRVSQSMGTEAMGSQGRLSGTTSIAIEHLRSDAMALWSRAVANPGTLMGKHVVHCMFMVAQQLKDIPLQLQITDTALMLETKLVPPPRMRRVVAQNEGEDREDGERPAAAGGSSAPPAVTFELDPDAAPLAGPILLSGITLTSLISSLADDRAPWQHVELVTALYEGHQRRYQKACEQGHWANASSLMLFDGLVSAYQRFLQRAMFFTHASEHDKVLHQSKKQGNWRYFLAQMTIASMQGDVEMARTVVAQMEEANVPYNQSLFTAQLGASIDSGDWAEAERVWLKALSLSIPMCSFSYSKLMQVYLTAGGPHLAKIDALRAEMAAASITFDAADYTRLFQTCFDLRNAAVFRVLFAQSQRDGTFQQLSADLKRMALSVDSWRLLPPRSLSRHMRRRANRERDLIRWNIQVPKTEAERAADAVEAVKAAAEAAAAKDKPMTKARKIEIKKSMRRRQTAKVERLRADALELADRRRLLYSGGVRGGRGVLTPYAYPKVRSTAVLRPKVSKGDAEEKREHAQVLLRKYGPRLPPRRFPAVQAPARPTGFFGRLSAAVSDVREGVRHWLSEFRRQAFPREQETDELWEPKKQVQPVIVPVDTQVLHKPHGSINSRLNRLARKTTIKARRRTK